MKIKEEKIKKISSLCLIIMLSFVFQLFSPSIATLGDVVNIDLKLTTNKSELKEGEEVEFSLEYKSKNGPGSIKKGEVLEFKLPDVFTNIKPKYPTEHFSSVEVNGTTVKATFSEGAETAIGGYIKIKSIASNVKVEGTQRITVELNGTTQYVDIYLKPKVTIPPTKPDSTTTVVDRMLLKKVESSYLYSGYGAYANIARPVEGKFINHSLYINEKRVVLNNAKVIDNMPAGTVLVTSSVKIFEISNTGNKVDVTESLKRNMVLNESLLQVNFNNTNSTYKVEYSVKITEDKEAYNNVARLTNTDGNSFESKTSVKTINDDTLIKKYNNYNNKFIEGIGDKVNYTLYVNSNNKNLTNVYIEDIIPKGMELLNDGSFRIGEYDIEGKFTWSTNKYKYNLENNRLFIDLGNTNKGYIISYTTKVTNREKTYNNKAKLGYDLKSTSIENIVKYEMNAGAINAKKSVDTNVIKKGDSQKVKYSIEFSVYGYFQKNYINLIDNLDKRIKIEKVEVSDSLSYSIDKENNIVIVKNDNSELNYGEKVYVNIFTDFTDVPNGTTIQNIASINNTTTNRVETKKGYAFKARKVDSTNNTLPLKGAKFSLKDESGQEVTTLTSDENGIITSEVNNSGKYYLQEIEAPKEYVLNDNKISFNISDNQVGSVLNIGDITNRKDEAELEIKKVDSDDKEKVLVGGKINIKDSSGNIIKTLITDKDGLANAILVPGKYKVEEVESPNGYVKSEEIIDVTIKSGQTEKTKITFENKKDEGEVVIKKVDSENNKLLEGATFEITNEVGDTFGPLVTGKDGISKIKLVPGNYKLSEISAPAGYLKSDEIKNIQIKSGELKTLEFIIENKPIKKQIKIISKDADNEEGLLGSEFEVQDLDGNKITTVTTDESGKFTANLKPGKYRIILIKVPNGYSKESEPQIITVGEKEENTELVFKSKKSVIEPNTPTVGEKDNSSEIKNNENKGNNSDIKANEGKESIKDPAQEKKEDINNDTKENSKKNSKEEIKQSNKEEIKQSNKEEIKQDNNKTLKQELKKEEKIEVIKEGSVRLPYTGAVISPIEIALAGVVSLVLGYFLIKKK